MKLANRHWVVLALLLLLVVIGLWIRYPGADIGWSLRDYDRLGEMLFDDIGLVLELLAFACSCVSMYAATSTVS